jgi:urease accessory protein
MTTPAALLLLADGRLPAGGYAHSGGLEHAVSTGSVADLHDLESFLRGRLQSCGMLVAGLAAAAWSARDATALGVLDVECDACTPSPAQRATSRSQGRSLLRLASRMWPGRRWSELPTAPHHCVALGALVRVVDGSQQDAAMLAALGAVTGPASAAVRLMSLDPVEVQVLLAELTPLVEELAVEAVLRPRRPGSVLLDLLAEAHAGAELRLFAS